MTAAKRSDDRTIGAPPPVQGTPTGSFSHPDQHSFILQAIMEMQKTLGGLEAAVDNLVSVSEKQAEKVDAVNERLHSAEKKLYAAGAIIALLSIFAPKILDAIFNVIRAY